MIELLDLGFTPYLKAWELQKKLLERRINEEITDTLILVEHDPVFTLGKNRDWNNLLFPMETLKNKGFSFFKIERGGDITYHGPGQLVGYPIFKIKNSLAGVKDFVRRVEEALILTLKDYGIEAYRHIQYTGVFTAKGKIASIGIAFKKWVSFHGFALNVNNDLKPFNYIIPCGISNIPMTSMRAVLGKEIDMENLKKTVYGKFVEVFRF